MALHFYHDSGATNLVEAGDVDHERKAEPAGNTVTIEQQLYIGSDDINLTYENVTVSSANDFDGTTTAGEIDVEYALDSGGSAGTYNQSLDMANQDFDPAVPIWRKITAPSITDAFKISNIEHHIDNYDEYVK